MYLPRSPTYTILQKLAPEKPNSSNFCFYFEVCGSFVGSHASYHVSLQNSSTCQPSEVSEAAAACHLTKVVKGGDYVHRVGCVTLPMEPSTDGTLGCQISPLHCTAPDVTGLY